MLIVHVRPFSDVLGFPQWIGRFRRGSGQYLLVDSSLFGAKAIEVSTYVKKVTVINPPAKLFETYMYCTLPER